MLNNGRLTRILEVSITNNLSPIQRLNAHTLSNNTPWTGYIRNNATLFLNVCRDF